MKKKNLLNRVLAGFLAAVLVIGVTPLISKEVLADGRKPAKSVITSVKSMNASSLKISWKELDADGYRVYRSTSKSGSYKRIATLNDEDIVSYVDKGLKKGKTYYYKVRAFEKEDGQTYWGAYSAVKSGKPVAKQAANVSVGKPSITSIKGGVETVTLKWSKVSGADGYRIYSKEKYDDDGWDYVAQVSAKKLSYVDRDADDGVQQYRIRAYKNVNGKKVFGSYSSVKTVKVRDYD